ncbi:MAG: single-stranded DNA-binding protein [Clostridia bacterium]|nr:single-stranded DNA-binding protein [Clostridia bacterium]
MNVNKVFLMGRLTANPELKVSSSGVNVLRFTVAVSRKVKRDETDFIECAAFKQTAEFISKYFKKGSAIIVFGHLRIEPYTDKNGNKRVSTRVMADEVQFGEKSNKEDKPSAPSFDELEEIEDLPF